MTRRRARTAGLPAVVLAGLVLGPRAGTLHAQQAEEPIVIDHADELRRLMEADSLTYLLTGNVRAHRADVRMRSQRATIYRASSIADFEQLIARTTFAPDSNEGYVDRTLGTCLVGPSELDCETKSYRVRIGDREANLDITRSDKLPGRDIGGEITGADGEVIYRAELLEVGNDAGSKSSVAAR